MSLFDFFLGYSLAKEDEGTSGQSERITVTVKSVVSLFLSALLLFILYFTYPGSNSTWLCKGSQYKTAMSDGACAFRMLATYSVYALLVVSVVLVFIVLLAWVFGKTSENNRSRK